MITFKTFPNNAFAVIRVRPTYVRTIQKSLVTPLKPPATMVLKGTVPSGFEIVVFIRSRKWPATMVREGVTSGSWEIYQSKNQESYTLFSGGSRPCAKEGGEGEVFCRLDCRLFFLLRFFFFFLPKIRKGEVDWIPRASSLDPPLLLQG